MKFSDAWQIQVAHVSNVPRVGRMQFEVGWAVICPPSLALLTVFLASEWWEGVIPENSNANPGRLLMPLMLGGMAVLSAVIYLDRRAVEAFRSRAERIRTIQGISTAITLMILAVAVTTQAERKLASQAADLAIFLYLPVLFTSGAMLWHAATLLQSSFCRGMMLVGFMIATVLVELSSAREDYRDAEERLFMLNSLLVALAFAIQLSVWSLRTLGHRQKGEA